MSETADWDPTFAAVHKVPGSKQQQPSKKTYEDLAREAEFSRNRYASDVAVAMGAVDTGADFDPYGAIAEQHDTGGAATAALRRETTSIAAGLAQLQSDVTANNNSGKSFIVAVADSGLVVPTVFDLIDDSGAGGIFNDGNTLQMSNNDGRELLGYNVEALVTDYFEVSLIVPKQAGTTFNSYVNRALFFLGRGDATWDNYCFARLNGDKLRIGAVIDGVSTLDSPVWFGLGVLGAGSDEITINTGIYMTFGGGTLAGQWVFQFKVNNQVVATFGDAANASLIGDDYRWTGLGIRNDGDFGNRSPTVSHFVANDNSPAAVVGSGGRMERISTGAVNISSGSHALPASFFDNPGALTEDINRNVSAGTYEVTEADWYKITVHLATGTGWPNHFRLRLFLNGLADDYMSPDTTFGTNVLGGAEIPEGVHGSWSGYLNALDEVEVGYDAESSALSALRGTASGKQSYFTISRGR